MSARVRINRAVRLLAIGATPAIALFGLHRSAAAGVVVTPTAGYTVTWEGDNGPRIPDPALVPSSNDLALVSNGGTAFASSQLYDGTNFPQHQYVHLNDGIYGNNNSWISAAGDAGDAQSGGLPYAGIALAGATNVTTFAFSRDMDSSDQVGGCGNGPCDDRSQGLYTIQITDAANPASDHADWITIGTLNYTTDGSFNSALQHTFDVSGPELSTATGLRLIVPEAFNGLAGTDIDEIEIYSVPEPASLSVLGLAGIGLLARRRR